MLKCSIIYNVDATNGRKTNLKNAAMAELADAHGSGPCESNLMEVQVLLAAPVNEHNVCCCSFFFVLISKLLWHKYAL